MEKQVTLPPKQFDDASLPEFDPIRPRAWFPKLYKGRSSFWNLKMAHAEMTACASINEPNDPSTVIAQRWEVDPKDLKRYIAFAGKLSDMHALKPVKRKAYQIAMDLAYDAYCRDNGRKPFHFYLAETASSISEDADAIVTLWETDHSFYPTGYRKAT